MITAPLFNSLQFIMMIQQQVLQTARQAMCFSRNSDHRRILREQAIRMGRDVNAVHKASNMRLAQWARNKNSPV